MERYDLTIGDKVVECVVKDNELILDDINYALLLPADGSDQLYFCTYDPEFGIYTIIEDDDDWDYIEERYEHLFSKRLEEERYGSEVPEIDPSEDEGSYYKVTIRGVETECDIIREFKGPKGKFYAVVEPVDKDNFSRQWEIFRCKSSFFGIFGERKLIPITNDDEYQRVLEIYNQIKDE